MSYISKSLKATYRTTLLGTCTIICGSIFRAIFFVICFSRKIKNKTIEMASTCILQIVSCSKNDGLYRFILRLLECIMIVWCRQWNIKPRGNISCNTNLDLYIRKCSLRITIVVTLLFLPPIFFVSQCIRTNILLSDSQGHTLDREDDLHI